MISARRRFRRSPPLGLLLGLVVLMVGGACAPDKASDKPVDGEVGDKAAEPADASVASGPTTGAASPVDADVVPVVDEGTVPTILRLPDPRDIGDSPKGLGNGAFAPQLDLPDLLGGGRYRFSTHVGPEATESTRVAIVGFTASWCGPCKSSYPYLKTMQEQFGDDLEVVLVSMDKDREGRDKEATQVRAAGLAAPVLDPNEDVLRAWLGRRRNVPHFFIINKVGEVLVQDRGFGKNVQRVLPKQIGYALRHPEYVVRKKKSK